MSYKPMQAAEALCFSYKSMWLCGVLPAGNKEMQEYVGKHKTYGTQLLSLQVLRKHATEQNKSHHRS